MNILIACETSGVVREAFRALGHDVTSCDLLPADDSSPHHIVGDCREVISAGGQTRLVRGEFVTDVWDLIIMHPPCTALSVSGNRWYGRNMPKHQQRLDAIRWTMDLWTLARRHSASVCMENPVGVLPLKPTQYIQPFQFGHPESKKTGLWLWGLPELEPTDLLPTPVNGRWDNQTPSGQNKLGPSPDRWKIRSKTYDGIAQAMANKWGAK